MSQGKFKFEQNYLSSFCGATTFSKTTLGIATTIITVLNKITLIAATFSIPTLIIMTQSRTTLKIKHYV